ncbi:hypothetical protein F5B22DRAFT_358965 [Xylaria bambusicola]|uniref:uncharacterized protein n=1 Tax=Xylaria bambusicola TaxID=326684 RepID=UPI002008B096|nr:uncharacterized protein F5B22DRAFT_358965 [Xylaria bambusicola]KAI0509285.1 hypothetical protein F5B22DRAFT_358965 [Xylaria bambusicola]
MPTNSGSVFSETLQEITNTKLEELSKRRSQFETTKASIISRLEDEKDPLKRLGLLSQGVKDSYAIKTTKTGEILAGESKNAELELELRNLDSFMAQSKYDPSITPQLMRVWEESLLRHLYTQSSKFEYASLYAQLVTEWLSTERAVPGTGEDVEMAEGYEDVGDSMKKEARHTWEKVVFEPAEVDGGALRTYLLHLFGLRGEDKPAKAKALEQLRRKLTEFEVTMAAPKQFDPTTLTWVIKGLLASDLLTDERREVLRDFLSNSTILAEVADVLNMRLAALSTWSWGDSVALEQQRKISGVYNVLMHEDVLQAVFLHYIGVKWSVFLKGAFRQFRKYDGAWKSSRKTIPQLDQQRREYYIGVDSIYRNSSVHSARDQLYRKHYFMAGLMSHTAQQNTSLEGEEEANYAPQMMVAQQAQRQAYQMGSMVARAAPPPAPAACRIEPAGLFGSSLQRQPNEQEDSDSESEERRPMEDKQRLIRLLSAEIAIGTKLHGEVTTFHSVFESWNSLLPHETILTVMSLLGVSETWIAFFNKFLRAPLKFLDDSPDTAPRTRRRGTPASHALSEIFGESILFCLDFSVNQATEGHNLHRMNEDFWFWSRDHTVAKTAWTAVSDFVNATRTYINLKKSGTVRISRDPSVSLDIDQSLPVGDIRWGFLKLSTKTGKFEIDQAMVDKHIVDLRRQLADKRKSVISFIQTWNTFAATFFTSNFGQPANCFGREHVDQILATHQRIQREVFSPSSSSPSPLLIGEVQPKEPITGVVEYLKHLLHTRFGVSDIPDAYLFFPIELGGLDLRSPFVSILPVREAVLADPNSLLDVFLEAERDEYARRKLAFERGDRYVFSHRGNGAWEPSDPREREVFMPFEEYVRHREDLNYNFRDNLTRAFKKLLEVPSEEGGVRDASAAVRDGIEALADSSQNLKGITGDWETMEPYWRWVAQLYGPEAIKCFGGLNIVEPGLLPMGMVSIFRDKRVKWQG